MTTTLEALQRGSARLIKVMAIEGIDHLLTNGTEADAQAAWAGTDWDGKDVFTGCSFDIKNDQSADPWNPFQSGGSATVVCLDDAFGVMTHRKGTGSETVLEASLDRDDTTITVQSTDDWAAEGELHIGTECVAYETDDGTTFTATQRGLYSPFGTSTDSHFAHDHRVGIVSGAPNLQPKVTQFPRTWIGRYVGIWLHTYDENGINSKADALCIFAGKIAEVRDDVATIGTVLICDHVLTSLKDASVGRDLFEGEVRDGFYLKAFEGSYQRRFDLRDQSDRSDSATIKDANPLLVVESGATGTNEVNEGYYTLNSFLSVLNAWLAGEKTAGRISGVYTIGISPLPSNELRVKMSFIIPGSDGDEVSWGMRMPRVVGRVMGWDDGGATGTPLGEVNIIHDDGGQGAHSANVSYEFQRNFAPLRMWFDGGLAPMRVMLDVKAGVPQDQYNSFPANLVPHYPSSNSPTFGLFMFDEKTIWRASYIDNGDGTVELADMDPLSLYLTHHAEDDHAAIEEMQRRADDPTPIKVRQVYVFGGSAATLVGRLLYSTGTLSYNSGFDKLPFGFGIGLPGGLLGTAFNTSVAAMPGAGKPLVIFIDKATKLSQLIGSDLLLRRAFPVWKQGGLRIATWQTPSLALAIATLDGSNKAEPAGRKADQRTATLQSARWAKSIIKIRHTRDLLKEHGGGSEYYGTINIEDRTAVDDGGDRGDPLTIDARNSYSEFVNTGAGIESLVDEVFIPGVPLFSQPMGTMRRSIALTHYETLAPGDVVSLTDTHARDQTTGLRRIANVPATVIRITSSLGGQMIGEDKPTPMVGEVELMLPHSTRIYAYAPSALATSYNSGTKTLTLAAHEYSETSEDADVDNFAAGDAIRITEVDPADPSTALTWTRSIVSKVGNTITHDGVALAGFDAGKDYRVTFDTYSAVVSGQQDKAFQADDADSLIEDLAQANTFGLAMSSVAFTEDDHTTLGEFPADVDVGDGKAYDVGSLKGAARLIDNLIDHKTAISSPALGPVMGNTTYSSGDGRKLVSVSPIFLTGGLVSASVERFLAVAPWFHSTDGTTTTCHVTLAPVPPQDSTVDDIGTIPNSATAIFTTSSTTWGIPDPIELPVSVKGNNGIAWLIIEAGYKCETRGLAHCHETERR